MGYTKEEFFRQWYPATAEEAFIYSGKQVFPAAELRIATEECFNPLYVGDFNMHNGRFEAHVKGMVKVWEKPIPGAKYVIGADIAEGLISGDFTCCDVLKLPFGEQVAQIHGKIDPDTFGEILNYLGRYYNKALIGVEANNHGLTTITSLKRLNYPNQYQREKLDSSGHGKKVKQAGWLTTKKSKYKIIDQLASALRDGESGVVCKDTVKEMGEYTIHEGDAGSCTYGAKLGCFDDLVMSLAIALEMLYTIPKARNERDNTIKKSKNKHANYESASDYLSRSNE
jgi:hypothetical protein